MVAAEIDFLPDQSSVLLPTTGPAILLSILLQFRVPLSYGQKRPAAACRNDERAVEIFKLFFSLFPFYALAEKLFKRTLTLSSN